MNHLTILTSVIHPGQWNEKIRDESERLVSSGKADERGSSAPISSNIIDRAPVDPTPFGHFAHYSLIHRLSNIGQRLEKKKRNRERTKRKDEENKEMLFVFLMRKFIISDYR